MVEQWVSCDESLQRPAWECVEELNASLFPTTSFDQLWITSLGDQVDFSFVAKRDVFGIWMKSEPLVREQRPGLCGPCRQLDIATTQRDIDVDRVADKGKPDKQQWGLDLLVHDLCVTQTYLVLCTPVNWGFLALEDICFDQVCELSVHFCLVGEGGGRQTFVVWRCLETQSTEQRGFLGLVFCELLSTFLAQRWGR